MAVVKAKYVKRDKQAPRGAKDYIQYFEQRPGKNRQKIARTLFGAEGKMTKQEACRLIDQAKKGSVFYKIIINFDAKREDTKRDLHIREITEKTMQHLQDLLKKQIDWVATIHDDHTPLRHVHLLAVVDRILNTEQLQTLRTTATTAALFQRQQLDLAQGLTIPKQQSIKTRHDRFQAHFPTHTWKSRGVAPPRTKTCICYHCGLRQSKSYFSTLQHCLRCGSEIKQGRTISLTKEAEWDR
jgi:hypothetical protein